MICYSRDYHYHHHPVSSGVDAPRERGGNGAEVALCLSGGGLRAALFHLGALRRLNELGILGKVDTITSVSGGSILAAFLARYIRDGNEWPVAPKEWRERISEPFSRIASRDLRTVALIGKYLPWNIGVPGSRIRMLARAYDQHLTEGMELAELPDRPEFRFCASDLHLGVPWIFSKERAGNALRGYLDPRQVRGAFWTVANAVAASSCFPPVFGPMRIDLRGAGLTSGTDPQATLFEDALLSDGGVIDNFGVETVRWTHRWIILSDGGAPLRFDGESWFLPGLQLALATSGHMSTELNKRWIVDQFFAETRRLKRMERLRDADVNSIGDDDKHVGPQGTYFGISSAADGFGSSLGYSRDLAERSISRIRTDLNAFSEAEQQILENHAYLLAEASASRFLEGLIVTKPEARPPYDRWWKSTSSPCGPDRQPRASANPDMERHVAAALARSPSHLPLFVKALLGRLCPRGSSQEPIQAMRKIGW